MVTFPIAEVKISVLMIGSLFLATRVGPVKSSSFYRIIEELDGLGVLMCLPKMIIKKWFDYGILRFVDRIYDDKLLEFFSVASMFEDVVMRLVYITGFLTNKRLGNCAVLESRYRSQERWLIVPRKRLTRRS